MDTTVERLKVGTQVIIGSYGVNNDEPHPVVWLKGSPNCDFITECAVDYLCFDAPERTGDGRRNLGNPDYRLSNIHTYLNSDRDDWFRKTHEADALRIMFSATEHKAIATIMGFYTSLKIMNSIACRCSSMWLTVRRSVPSFDFLPSPISLMTN